VVGFPTIGEIVSATGVDVGVAVPEPTGAAIAAAIEQVRSASWDRAGLRRAVLDAYAAGDVAAEYASVLDGLVR
jgi:hypothetical protein